jgi:biopolymer transport protein ExbD
MQRRLQPRTDINMTPLVDVVLQLIIFFMITTTFRTVPGIKLDLPGSNTVQSVTTTAMKVVVVSDNEIYVDKTRTTLTDLPGVIRLRIAGVPADKLQAVLEGVSTANYQLIISVLDAFRMNGVKNVGLMTRKEIPSR